MEQEKAKRGERRKQFTEPTIGKMRPAPKGKRVEWSDAQQPGLYLRITDTGRKSWIVYWRDQDGKRQRETLGSYPEIDIEEARGKAKEIRKGLSKGTDPKTLKRLQKEEAEKAKAHTFKSVAEDYMADTTDRGGAHLRSKDELKRKLEKDIYPTWKDRSIRHITRGDVLELIERKARTSPVAANRVAALVSRIFNYALDRGKIDSSPAVRIPKQVETSRERVLSDAELAAIWKAADAIGYPFGPCVQFLILTAQRRGEGAGLEWHEIDGENWRLPAKRSKTGQGHLIPLSAQAQALVSGLPRFKKDCAFTTTEGEKPIGGWTKYRAKLNRVIAEARAEEAGEDLDMEKHAPAHWTLHDLRRTTATGMRSLGFDRTVVDKVLNHADGGMISVYDRYSADPEKRRALQAWADHVESIVTGMPVAQNVVALHG